MLLVLGSSSAFLLLPAVIEKENKNLSYVKGDNSNKKEESSITKTVNQIKTEYIEYPINKVVETKTEITKYINNPEKIINNKIFAETEPNKAIGNIQNTNSTEPTIRITKEMVDNCKIITDEYNKVKN